jgi:ubiquitin carboxyl-terminal hydrolase 36/42
MQECQQSNSVGDSLEAFFKVDLLSGDNRYRCEKCKKLSNAHKRFLFHKLPQVLTIQLKRFTNNLQKLDKTVRYEPAMNLTKYCDNQQKQVHY